MADSVRARRAIALGAAIALVVGLASAVVWRATRGDSTPVARLTTPGASTANEPGLFPVKADGRALPDTALTGLDGTRTTMRALAGAPLVVNFWATSCAACVTEMPTIERVHASLGGAAHIVGVDAGDGPDLARQFVAKTGVTYPVWLDAAGAAQAALQVSVLPTTVFVSADGVVRKTVFGAMDEAKLRATIGEVFGTGATG